jgi:uncharacterized protein (TIGR03437 family)
MTWKQSLGNLYNGCQDLVIRTDTTTDYLFASCTGVTYTDDYTIWRNQDVTGSGKWTMVQTAPHMIRTSLALAPSQQTTIYAMAASLGGTQGYDNGLLAVFRSTTNGDSGTWTTTVANTDPNLVNTDLLSSFSCKSGTPPSQNQGWYDNVLAVDPTNPNVVWAGGVYLFRSDDGGVNWAAALLPPTVPVAQYIHPDHHVIVFHPGYNGSSNQIMFEGNDGGLYSTDSALAPVVISNSSFFCAPTTLSMTWTDLNTTYVATQYYHGIAYPGGGAYFGGAQDNGVSRGSDAVGPNQWSLLSSGDGGVVAVDPADANAILYSTENLSLMRSSDGVNFTKAISGITETSASFPFIAALGADPNNGSEMFLGGTTNLWRTVDGANSWTAAAPVEEMSSVTAIAVSPRDSNIVLFGTATGRIYRSSNALATNASTFWQFAVPRSDFASFVGSIAFDWNNPDVVYATYSTFNNNPGDAHVYKSLDGGVTWAASDGSGASAIPDVPVFRLLVNPHDSAMLIVGTDLGVFVSTDEGNSWQRDSDPFSDVITEELAVDQNSQSNWLFAFTYGRGTYRTGLPGAGAPQCNYSVTPTNINAPAWGGIYPVTVTAPQGCAWAALPGSNTAAAYVQSPAQGSGNGTAWVVAEPTNFPVTPQTLTIAGQSVTVTQQNSFGAYPGDEVAIANPINIPGVGFGDTQSFTSNPNDPVHSCTKSADSSTAWWKVSPAVSGTLQVQGIGYRLTTYGNYGLVLTAYPATSVSQPGELGCAVVPRDTSTPTYGFLRFAVTAGTTYLIEASAIGVNTTDVGDTGISVMMGTGPLTVSVTPPIVQLTAGGAGQQFTGSASNGPNRAVRWSLSPVGVGTITPGGLYTPPAVANAATKVTLTASAFANPQTTATATINIVPSSTEPVITNVQDAESARTSVVPGEWAAIYGSNLAASSRTWATGDFTNGNSLPTSIDGVSVRFGGLSAAVYYVSPTQIDVQVPGGLSGSVPVIVTLDGAQSASFMTTVLASAPSLFFYQAGSVLYAAATHVDGSLIGDPAVTPGATKAGPGETIVLYVNGLDSSASGTIISTVVPYGNPVTVTVGTMNAPVTFAGLVAAGQYQLNVALPGGLAAGNYPITVGVGSQMSPANVMLAVQ